MLCDIEEIEYAGKKITVLTDNRGLYFSSIGSMKRIGKALLTSSEQITNEELTEITKERLLQQCGIDMYMQCFNEKPKSMSQEGFDLLLNPEPIIQKSLGRKPSSGFVYFLKNSNMTKIGRAKDINTRLSGIKLPVESELVHTVKSNDYSKCEKFFHAKFSDKRMNGEWFKLTAKDIEYCQKIETLDF